MCWYPAKYSRAGYLRADTSWDPDKSLYRPLQRTVPGDKTVISSLFVFPYPSGRGLYDIIFILNPAYPRPVFLPVIDQISTNPSSQKDANIKHARSDHRGSSSQPMTQKKSTQRQNGERSKHKVSQRKMHRSRFSSHEPNAERKERKNLVGFS